MSTTSERPTLLTGWEAGVDDGDTLCRAWLHHWADVCASVAAAARGTVVRDERFCFADHGRPAAFFNSVVLLAPPADWSALLDEIEHLASWGTGELHLWSIWPTPDLHPRGWVLDGHPPLLVRPPATAVPVAAPDPAPEPVRDPAALARWERVLVEGYPLPDVLPLRPGRLFDPALLGNPRWRFFTSGPSADPVAVSAQFVSRGLAGFAIGVTRPQARRGGHWWRHALTRIRHEPDLWQAGVFSDASRPGAEAIGFVPVLRHTLWHRDRE
ncbi:MAG TPA: hypothetical protein VD813_16010 [Pseudonocardia sp.]|nr:hypothetical protein [Pseudonocardia sp.]